jgi:hypothetical protein
MITKARPNFDSSSSFHCAVMAAGGTGRRRRHIYARLTLGITTRPLGVSKRRTADIENIVGDHADCA